MNDLRLTSRPRILSGMRPTGRLHLGNYVGALRNWVELQNRRDDAGEPVFDCFFFIADWHALTTDYADPSRIKQNVYEVALDFLSAGLDPERSTIFIQSHVPQHAELNLLLSMITPLSWLERVPTYKDQQEQLREKDLATYGFLGYPLLQSADILLYRPQFVPVGADQVAHVEITREIARRFNFLYPRGGRSEAQRRRETPESHARWEVDELLPEPEVLLTPSPKLPGTDGRKMSKSYGNTVQLRDSSEVVWNKIKEMTNGGQRDYQSDPGDPEICPVGDLHRVFSSPGTDDFIRSGCRTAAIGCLDCKSLLSESINHMLGPIRYKRAEWECAPERVFKVLETGAGKAREQADRTLDLIRSQVGLSRDTSGVKLEPGIVSGDFPVLFTLVGKPEWQSLDTVAFQKEIEAFWFSSALPVDDALQRQDDGSFLTERKKRVLVLSAKEEGDGFLFSAPPKSYEVVVLLCYASDSKLFDFVVPQMVYVASWSAAKKRDKKAPIRLAVKHSGNEFFLRVSDAAEEINITEFRSAYATLG